MNVRWQASNLTTLGGSLVIGLFAALSLTGIVMAGVVLFMRHRSSSQTDLLLGVGAVVAVAFGALTALAVQRTRARVALGWDVDALRLDIRGPRGSAAHRGPFRVEKGWARDAIATGRGGSVPVLVVMIAILDRDGRALLYLREQLGALHSPPAGWPQREVVVDACEHVYTNSLGRLHLDRLAEALAPED
jgi:hypothetical protein